MHDAVLALAFGLLGSDSCNASATQRRPRSSMAEGDRLLHVRLGGDEFRLESGREHHARDELLRVGIRDGGGLRRDSAAGARARGFRSAAARAIAG